MSITAIPNQPIGFAPSRIVACQSIDPAECMLMDATGDTLTFQAKWEQCVVGNNLITDPSFNDAAQWYTNDWAIAPAAACNTGPGDGTVIGASLAFLGTVTPGNMYRVEVTFRNLSSFNLRDGCQVYLGGQPIGLVNAPGTYTFIVTAVGPGSIGFVLTANSSACIEQANVWDVTPQFIVEVVDSTDTVATSFDYATDPQYFTLVSDRVTVSIPTSDIDVEGCHTVRFIDDCDGTALTSQCINFGTFDCSLLISACNTSDAVGFMNPWRPEMRMVGTVRRPTYQSEYSEERGSNGVWNRPFGDRQTRLEMSVEPVGEVAHAFLSTLGLYDHFYIGQDEYIVISDTYEPAYSDVYDSTGGIIISIAPKVDLARKVRVTEDNGGCKPPPNYLVQGTGPNEDYVTQADGNLILLQ